MASQGAVRWPRRGRATLDGLQNRPYRPEGGNSLPALLPSWRMAGVWGAGPPCNGVQGPVGPCRGWSRGQGPHDFPDASIRRLRMTPDADRPFCPVCCFFRRKKRKEEKNLKFVEFTGKIDIFQCSEPPSLM